jgi:ubiquinone/menaquinone biosynthesis C-methylase UbiE
MSDIVFDEHVNGYDAWYQTRTGAFVDKVETAAAFRLLAPKDGLFVLDAGCGTGNYSLKLARMGCNVTGIDISENMLASAAQKATGENRVRFIKMDAAHTDFDDNSFDAVLSMAAFEFMPHPIKVYRELKRVVKPGGFIVIGTIQKGGAWEKLYSSPACAGTAYASASFKTGDDIVDLDRDAFTDEVECLFVPPGLDEEVYTDKAEAAGKAQGLTGGFICVKFVKQG